ncbi:MAG TPA: glycosyltransferase family 4 protein [Bacteroidales bacterium]|nr:glycosyltransferase family 4 protein [Bacteroidales bacterium]
MKIIHIIPGSGGSFYCGNCLRDSKYFDALRKMGHDVIKVPMYLPIFSDEHDISDVPVFYGAISIYLKQLYPVFEKAPAWFDRLLNSKPMLRLAASMAGSTRAKGLEEMTISMLEGEKGKQHEELEKMTDWMRDHFKPDVVHLSNALLLGLAKRLKEKLQVPVVCTLQDEDVWVDVMTDQSRKTVWNLMAENSAHVDLFVSVSRYFAEVVMQKMSLSPEKISTIHIGVDPDDYIYRNVADKKRNIGYLSRMCHENGMDILADAFILLKRLPGYEDVNLILTGGHTGDDKVFLKEIQKKINRNRLNEHVDFHKEFEGEGRRKFFEKTTLLCVPVRNGEAFGIYIAESMASGIPVVQPALGAFPEIIQKTGGGIIYKENTPEALMSALKQLLDNPDQLRRLSDDARKGAEMYLNINELAKELVGVYEELANNMPSLRTPVPTV